MAPWGHSDAVCVPGDLQGGLRLNWGRARELGNLALCLSSLDTPALSGDGDRFSLRDLGLGDR